MRGCVRREAGQDRDRDNKIEVVHGVAQCQEQGVLQSCPIQMLESQSCGNQGRKS